MLNDPHRDEKLLIEQEHFFTQSLAKKSIYTRNTARG